MGMMCWIFGHDYKTRRDHRSKKLTFTCRKCGHKTKGGYFSGPRG